ncbi:MAG: acyl-CoA dehydrogenase [Paracoccaceae bacterium]
MANANPKYRSNARQTLASICDFGVADEQSGASLKSSVEELLRDGRVDGTSVQGSCDLLLSLAETDLSLARLIEGHVNAAQLIARFGGEVPTGLLGVWGADSPRPASFDGQQLFGVKQYASGLGIVEHAIVSVATDEGVRLSLVRADDAARHDPTPWRMTGMQATVSGHFTLDGLRPHWLGPPDAYFHEPYFLGGVWRIAALQTGGTLGLLTAARDYLAEIDRLDADAQVARLAPLFGRTFAARGLVERAAHVAEGAEGRDDPDRAVALSVMARLVTEDLAQDAIKAVERSLGLSHFEDGSPTGAKARDLAVYCRQVARDALEQKAGRIVLHRDRPAEIWHG